MLSILEVLDVPSYTDIVEPCSRPRLTIISFIEAGCLEINRYPVKLVDVYTSWIGHHGYSKKKKE